MRAAVVVFCAAAAFFAAVVTGGFAVAASPPAARPIDVAHGLRMTMRPARSARARGHAEVRQHVESGHVSNYPTHGGGW